MVSFLCETPIDNNLPMEEDVLKECMSELKVKDRSQFQEATTYW